MKLIIKCDSRFIAFGQVGAAAMVAAGFHLDIFAIHVALDTGDVSDQVADGEFTLCECPFDFVGWDIGEEARGALFYFGVVGEEIFDFGELHGG